MLYPDHVYSAYVYTPDWGYLVLVLAILGWVIHAFVPAVMLALSLAALVYFLVQAPLARCGEIRNGAACLRNAGQGASAT